MALDEIIDKAKESASNLVDKTKESAWNPPYIFF